MNRKKAILMVPGKRYRGSAEITEFGEFYFRPYGNSENPCDSYRKLTSKGCGDSGYTIDYNEQTLRIHVSVPRHIVDSARRNVLLENLFVQALFVLGEYQI